MTLPAVIDRQNGASTPPSYADVRAAVGDQRSGKSTSVTAMVIDDCFDHINGLCAPSGERIVASPLTKQDRENFKRVGMYPDSLKYCRIHRNHESKVVEIPPQYSIISPVKIFANYHLYGIRYALISMADIIEHINSDLFDNSWVLLDEGGGVKARQSMEQFGKLAVDFYSTVGKRNVKLCVIAQYTRMLDVFLRLYATTRLLCSYDEATQYVSCDVTKRGQPKFTFDFWAPKYWRFFDTTEIIQTPQYRIDRALAPVYR